MAVTGMTCASCVSTIERSLQRHRGEWRRAVEEHLAPHVASGVQNDAGLWPSGIAAVFVSLMAGKAEVKYEPDVIGASDIAKLIEDLGFSATLMEHATVADGKLKLRVGLQHVPLSAPTLKMSPSICRFQG